MITPAYLDGFSSRFKVPVVDVRNPGLASVEILDVQLVLTVQLGEFRFDVGYYERDDRFGRLWRDEAISNPKENEVQSIMNTIDRCATFVTWHRRVRSTHRRLNLPATLEGMTVLAPGSEKAPWMPWRESDGLRMRPMITVSL